uniref:hypothetical protein n=1 Tax=Alistipes sp. TaxID=1872444 RepID=UPI004055B608
MTDAGIKIIPASFLYYVYFVILSIAKDLKVVRAVNGLTNREILHYVQNDTEAATRVLFLGGFGGTDSFMGYIGYVGSLGMSVAFFLSATLM